jgi:hypothetical protein
VPSSQSVFSGRRLFAGGLLGRGLLAVAFFAGAGFGLGRLPRLGRLLDLELLVVVVVIVS